MFVKFSKKITNRGGWCEREMIKDEGNGKDTLDRRLIEELLSLFRGTSVASFGEGIGMYK